MSAYSAAAPTAPGITGADKSLCLLAGLAPTGGGAYEDENAAGGGIGMGGLSSSGGTTTTEGSAWAGGAMGVNPGGRLLSGKFLYMYEGMTGEFGTVGTSGGRSVVVVVVTGGRGLCAWSGLRRPDSLSGRRSSRM
jgi:hypothetical protein